LRSSLALEAPEILPEWTRVVVAMRVIVLPFRLDAMRTALVASVHWYHAYRPPQSFGVRTPAEVYARLERVAQGAGTESTTRLTSDQQFQLEVAHLEGRKHLPMVEPRAAA
jgi:hypothetical protein